MTRSLETETEILNSFQPMAAACEPSELLPLASPKVPRKNEELVALRIKSQRLEIRSPGDLFNNERGEKLNMKGGMGNEKGY